MLAEKLGYRIKDVSVRWMDDDSRVRIISAVREDVRGFFHEVVIVAQPGAHDRSLSATRLHD